jgi:hypothetical protein
MMGKSFFTLKAFNCTFKVHMLKFFYLRSIAAFILAFVSGITYAQEAKTYFDKVVQISSTNLNGRFIYKSLDSLMHTRMPSRSRIQLQLNRKLDGGFNHQRILLCLNEIDYKLDFLTRNDSVYYSVIATANGFKGFDNYKYRFIKTDTVVTMVFLDKRNALYRSNKSFNDLAEELSLEEEYAFYCGDGSPKTMKGKQIESLVKRKNVASLRRMLQSICCETQAYGVAGFNMLLKSRYPVTNLTSN